MYVCVCVCVCVGGWVGGWVNGCVGAGVWMCGWVYLNLRVLILPFYNTKSNFLVEISEHAIFDQSDNFNQKIILECFLEI